MTQDRCDFDYLLVGGGLQSGLLALALRHLQPAARVCLLEKEEALGGNHTWCFHSLDVPVDAPWIDPLVSHRWSGYEVRFPGLQRRVDRPYAAIRSERLHEVVLASLDRSGCEGRLGLGVAAIEGQRVRMSDGTELSGGVVVDARGPDPNAVQGAGFQKFLGLEVRLSRPHGLQVPILMDATVDQSDGFRFLYLLPFGPTTLLLEDTRFTSSPDLDRPAFRREILDYASRQGLEVEAVLREEEGVLAMPWGRFPWPRGGSPVVAGYRGGWFHPATGYSFPVAARLAAWLAASPGLPDGADWQEFSREHRTQFAYGRLLNRLLFRWFPPANRVHVFERFYRLPDATIERFYALRLGRYDRARILVGRPPRGMSIRHRFGPGPRREMTGRIAP